MTRRWFLSLLPVCAVVRPAQVLRGFDLGRDEGTVYTIKTPTGCHILRERMVISVLDAEPRPLTEELMLDAMRVWDHRE